MSEKRAKGCLIAAVLWCVILALLAVGYRFFVHPYLQERLRGSTGGSSQYQDQIVLAADSFSGYAILRSEALKQQMRTAKIRYVIQNDKGDVAARLKALQEGKVHLAAFTIDSLLLAGARLNDFPGTIVLVLDETKGGDAIVAAPGVIKSLQDLNRPDARIVLTANSPSEFLARVVVAQFNLPNLPETWSIPLDGPRAVLNHLRTANPNDPRAFVLWEPYVTKALETQGTQVLLDSSRLKGYIVDVLVAQRQFLRDHPERVQTFVEAYCRAAYAYAQPGDAMVRLVQEDARQTGSESLNETQARQVVQGIRWKNTLENYAHFGLAKTGADGGLEHLEDIIAKIADVLVKTRAISAPPLEGRYHTLFYSDLLADLQRRQFHPGKGAVVIPGLGPTGTPDEQIRSEAGVKTLTPEQWTQLQPVGELRVDPIVFSRGGSSISVQSERDLSSLARRLQSFPNFYLRVIGQTRAEGDAEANRSLAQARAEAVARVLRTQGISADRMRTEAVPSDTAGGEGQSVRFVVGQVPY
ncbi:MAG TPA: phosphate ABC transporter substrate-binding/OmpA family protein [Verrucomicrobiota bacterium]|nr:phosphate ABC transporter substrate-binding/OmpA family protein [Verrucomicrobiota bacterium]HNU49938.1 phosphate ABC transporter substrate-binding/OmpA family protein [Verrucomicrobiota bacterium]